MCLSTLRICKRYGRPTDLSIASAPAPPTPAPYFPTLPRGYGSGNFLDANHTFRRAQSTAATTMALPSSIVTKDFAIMAPEKEKVTRHSIRKQRREEVLAERRELGIVMGDIFGLESVKTEQTINQKDKEIENPVTVAVAFQEVIVDDGEVKAVEDDGTWSDAEFDAHMGLDSNEPMKKLILLPRKKTTLRKQDLDPPFEKQKPLKGAKPVTHARRRPTRSLYIPEEEIIHRTQFLKNNLARNILLKDEIAVLSQKIEKEKKVVLDELDFVLARNEYVVLMIQLSKKDKDPVPQEFWDNVHFRLKQHLGYKHDAMYKWAHVEVALEMVASMEEEIEDNWDLIQADRRVLADAAFADANY